MIIPDVNLLLYAVVSGFPKHERGHECWEGAINDRFRIGLTPPAVFGFLRIVTNARVLQTPLAASDAAGYVRDWLAQPNIDLRTPGPDHLEIALDLLESAGMAGNLTTNAQLAAYAVEHDAEVHSNDTDFARFPRVRWIDPLR